MPVWLMFTLLVIALFVYRLTTPYASNQDYRFIPTVLIPTAYFLLRTISKMPTVWQRLSLTLLVVYLGCCAGFTLWIVAG
jgi:hypothetical protein